MPDSQGRYIWCVARNGVPFEWRWAAVKAPSAGATNARWLAALTAEQAADPAYTAIRTEWSHVPEPLHMGVMDAGAPRVAVVGTDRVVEAHGLRYYVDDAGKADPEILDAAKLVAVSERLGRDVTVVDRRTREKVTAQAPRAVQA